MRWGPTAASKHQLRVGRRYLYNTAVGVVIVCQIGGTNVSYFTGVCNAGTWDFPTVHVLYGLYALFIPLHGFYDKVFYVFTYIFV